MSGTAVFFVVVGVGYVVSLPFKLVDRIEGKTK